MNEENGKRDADAIRSYLVTVFGEQLFESFYHPRQIAGDAYEMASEEQYAELGETDMADPSLPLIVRRQSDGAYFEIELDAYVWPTSPEARRKAREQRNLIRQATEKESTTGKDSDG